MTLRYITPAEVNCPSPPFKPLLNRQGDSIAQRVTDGDLIFLFLVRAITGPAPEFSLTRRGVGRAPASRARIVTCES